MVVAAGVIRQRIWQAKCCYRARFLPVDYRQKVLQSAFLALPSCSGICFSPESMTLLNQRRHLSSTDKNESGKNILNLSIDRTNLLRGQNYGYKISPEEASRRTPRTPLLKELESSIALRGPITISEYMSLALGHVKHGYYMRRDVFGAAGDFTTSPEISQLFGELIGVWCVSNWEEMGCPKKIRIVELGPGRGTLMSDLLRACSKFDEFCSALTSGGGVQMVETSPALRKKQQETLNCVSIGTMTKSRLRNESKANKLNLRGQPKKTNVARERMKAHDTNRTEQQLGIPLGQFSDDEKVIPVEWLSNFNEVDDRHDENVPLLIIAQELFDALPIHQFEMNTQNIWCERLVDVNYENVNGKDFKSSKELGHYLRFVLSPGPTPASRVLLKPEFQIKPTESEPEKTLQDCKPGDCIEVSAVSAALVQSISKRLASEGGAALIIDYGDNFVSQDSLRGIKDHEFVHPLQEPGEIDLSADVNFSLLKRMALHQYNPTELSRKGKQVPVEVHGPVTQGEFLTNLGIQYRVSALLKPIPEEDTEALNSLYEGYQRLVEGESTVKGGMGISYKAMAITSLPHNSGGKKRKKYNCAGFSKLE